MLGFTILALLVLFFAAMLLIYLVGRECVSDETLFDRMYLPNRHPRRLQYNNELPGGEPFKSVFDDPEVRLTLVIPAFNEERRLPPMLEVTLPYLVHRREVDPSMTWEVIVVDDGSKDSTCDVVRRFAQLYPEVRLLRQPCNMGKGAAVQAGSLHARGEYILMVDADGASTISCVEWLEDAMRRHPGSNRERIAVGSRQAQASRDPLRKFLAWGFHVLVWLAGVRGIKDTQCGFKLFSREAARWCFTNQHIQYWAMDPEWLMIARTRGMIVDEVPIEWNEIGGSKLKVKSMVRMGVDLLRVAAYYTLAYWVIRDRRALYAPAAVDTL